MLEEAPNPEDIFWQQITDAPGESLPRLVYADWCEENDRPVMAQIQRWLAATGRTALCHEEQWHWFSDTNPGVLKRLSLPPRLFWVLLETHPTGNLSSTQNAVYFSSLRASEEALVPAWTDATKRFWPFPAWKPDFSQAVGSTPLTYRFTRHIASTERSRIRKSLLIPLLLLPLAGLGMFMPEWSCSKRKISQEIRQLEEEMSRLKKIDSGTDYIPLNHSSPEYDVVVDPPGRPLKDNEYGSWVEWSLSIKDQPRNVVRYWPPKGVPGSIFDSSAYPEIEFLTEQGWQLTEKLLRSGPDKFHWEVSCIRDQTHFKVINQDRVQVWKKALEASRRSSKN